VQPARRGSLVESRGFTLTLELDSQPVCVDGDPARLQQIQVNLLNNSAKYTPRGGHVLLRVAREGAEAVVRVRDDGVGIPKHMLESVFELFVQSSRTLDRSDGGLGVGLMLVRSLVALHGGVVTAHSDGVGQGSEFVVRLPLVEHGAVASPGKERRRAPPGTGSKVVIVEDNDDSRYMLCAFLKEAGFHCGTASDGPSGLALINDVRPDAAVVDLGLPGMNGLDVARRLRSDPRHTNLYLVALTGYDSRQTERPPGWPGSTGTSSSPSTSTGSSAGCHGVIPWPTGWSDGPGNKSRVQCRAERAARRTRPASPRMAPHGARNPHQDRKQSRLSHRR